MPWKLARATDQGLVYYFVNAQTQESDRENVNHADYACLIMKVNIAIILHSTKNSGNIFQNVEIIWFNKEVVHIVDE